MVKSEKDKGIDGYGEAGDMYRKNKCRKSIYVKGLLVFMLAPPAGYIPRHCRGTPFKRGRCRLDVCLFNWNPQVASVTIEITYIAPTQPL